MCKPALPFFSPFSCKITVCYNSNGCSLNVVVHSLLQKLRKELNIAGLANFEKGAMDSINPELPVDEQAELLPYDKKWEFPRDKLKLGESLHLLSLVNTN
jgi:hypothetical protein